MGRKKKFIDKKQSSTFHVVHRSQQDKANEGEEQASEFVLIPSALPREGRIQAKGSTGKEAGPEGGRRDHINSLGLPNDGYDYDKHLKSLGGGTFVSKSGRVQHFSEGNTGVRGGASKVTIPEEALPSEETLERQLEAVTISEKVMDGDMRRALAAEDSDELQNEGNWLDDDFVVQAAGADDGGGFDFDAHVARLMEASARETGVRQRTEEDNLQTKGLARLKRQEDSDSDSDSDANSVTESDASGEFDEALLLAGLNIREEGGGGGGVLDDETNERAALDAQFEATLAGYDSDEWGELEEDDDQVKGQWDLEQHEYANTCLDEFIASKEDAAWTDGVERLPPDQRAIAVATLAIAPRSVSSQPPVRPIPAAAASAAAKVGAQTKGGNLTSPSSTVAFSEGGGGAGISPVSGVSSVKLAGTSAASGPRLGTLRGLYIPSNSAAVEEGGGGGDEDGEEDDDEFGDIGYHNEYLKEGKVNQWDCETIVSTYSNMDNHPSVLGTGRKAHPRRPRGIPASVGVNAEEGGRESASPVQQVALSDRTGLPLGVLPERTFNDKGMISLTAGKNAGEKRDAGENAEEKRLRKAQIKQQKQNKRTQKKSVKVAFNSEAKVIAHALANPEAQQNRSVFSYS